MGFCRFFVSIAAVTVLVGCANHEGTEEYAPKQAAVAPMRAVAGTAPAPADANLGAKQAPKVERIEDPFEAYNSELSSILRDRNSAQNQFESDVKKAGRRIEKEGFRALVPAYETYDRAVMNALKGLKSLLPPREGLKVSQALLEALSVLSTNLHASVAAMRSNNGEMAVQLNRDRRNLEATGAAKIKAALEEGGFDEAAFGDKGVVVRV